MSGEIKGNGTFESNQSTSSEKKISREVFFAAVAGVVLLALAVGLGMSAQMSAQQISFNKNYTAISDHYNSLMSNYNSLQANYSNLESSSAALQSEYDSLQQGNSYLQGQYYSLYINCTNLQYECSSLQTELDATTLTNLKDSSSWLDWKIDLPTGNSLGSSAPVAYAGYITFYVQSFYADTYVQLLYNVSGLNFSQTIMVGTNGTATFPVLPSTVYFTIGGGIPGNAFAANVTATYYH